MGGKERRRGKTRKVIGNNITVIYWGALTLICLPYLGLRESVGPWRLAGYCGTCTTIITALLHKYTAYNCMGTQLM
jgi:hypothetical protein